MPELPEVETVVRGLRSPMVGKKIGNLTLRRPDLRWPIPIQVMDLVGQRVRDVRRVAKTVVIEGENGNGWLIHLGMSGRLLILDTLPAVLDKHDHVVIQLDSDDQTIIFNDPRRFGAMDYFADQVHLDDHERLKNFGIDPTTQALSGQWLYEVTRGRKTPLKTFLLDQRHIAGLGNIYVSEALFRANLHPAMMTGRMTRKQANTLTTHIKETLDDAIRAGGSSLRDYVQASGELGYFQHQWRVYGKEAEPCGVCQNRIEKIVQQGRSSYFCSKCQQNVRD